MTEAGWGERTLGLYEAASVGAGAFVLRREVLSVEGPDAAPYLQGQLSQDLSALEEGASTFSLLLSPQGKLVCVLRVLRAGPQRYVMDFDEGFAEAVSDRLARFKLRSKLTIAPLEWKVVALRGPKAKEMAEAAGGGAVVLSSEWPGGVDLMGEDPRPPQGATVLTDAVAEALRLEAGVPKMGLELTEKTIAAEAGLVGWTVSFTKGCYVGQELVARIDARGSNVARRLVWVSSPEAIPPKGAELVVGGKVVGAVTSSSWSPRSKGGLGFAYLRREVPAPAEVVLRWESEDHPGEALSIPPIGPGQ